MTDSEITRFYAALDKKKRGEQDIGDIDAIVKLFRQCPGGRVLDIGCYDGGKTARIAEWTGAKPYGTDILPDRIARARKRGIVARKAMIGRDRLPFPAAFFDAAYCGDVIEHLFSPDALLDELGRVLKPGGQLIVTTPNLASWKNRIALLIGWQPFYSEVSTRYKVGNPRAPPGPPSGHIRMFTPAALRALLEKHGFRTLAERGYAARSKSVLGGLTWTAGRLVLPLFPRLGDELVVLAEKAAP